MSDIDWIEACREISREAAREILAISASEREGVVTSSGEGGDKTLLADRASENSFVRGLRRMGTDVRLLSEELGELIIGDNPIYTILLDPLDGSYNFKIGWDYFGISVAVMDRLGDVIAGYVLDVPGDTEYYADHEGSYRDGVKIGTSHAENADHVLLECSNEAKPGDIHFVSRILWRMRHLRAPGAVALDLCKVAEGTFDILLCAGTSRYQDVAAGIFILERAGGVVSDFEGNRKIREGRSLTAGNLLAAANEKLLNSTLYGHTGMAIGE
jgi:myo-inositol-1(or 4)-monophosphatase